MLKNKKSFLRDLYSTLEIIIQKHVTHSYLLCRYYKIQVYKKQKSRVLQLEKFLNCKLIKIQQNFVASSLFLIFIKLILSLLNVKITK